MRVVAAHVKSMPVDDFRGMGDRLRNLLKTGVGVLGMAVDDKVQFLCVVTDDVITDRNLRAGDIVKRVAELAGGSGGGKPHLALAGGKEVDQLDSALGKVITIVREFLQR